MINSDDEIILLEKAKDGNITAFEILIDKYKQKVYSLAFHFCGNEHDAFDISQEAFVKAFISIKYFKGNSSFFTWIYRIVKNTFLEEFRKHKPLVTTFPQWEEDRSEGKDPYEEIEKKNTSEMIFKCLLKLHPSLRLPLVMHDMDDFTYEEISDVLKIPLGTVKSRLNRAREILKKIIIKEKIPISF